MPNLAPLFSVEDAHPRARCCWCQAPLVSILKRTVWRCPRRACFARQMAHAVAIPGTSSVKYLYVPLPIQATFMEAVVSQRYRRILFGGAAGVSKSHGLRWAGHSLCLTKPGFRVLLLRRKFPQLEESHLSKVEAEAVQLGAVYVKTERVIRYGNDSRFKFGHCAEKGDETNYLSDEYDLVLFDEETTFEESQIVLISSRARTARPDWEPQVCGGTNPGGPSAPYCLSHFLRKNPDPLTYPHYRPDDYLYIAGTLDDNPYLNESYEKALDDLPGELREAYRFGNWDIFPGQAFKQWRAKTHHAELVIPAAIERICGQDWGYTNPGVILFAVVLPDRKLYVDYEFVHRETVASEVARQARAIARDHGWSVRYSAADPAINIRSHDSGESIAETMRRHGWPTRNAKNDRVNGWARVRQMLAPDRDGVPFLRVSPARCPYLCRTMPLLVTDDHKPEDINSESDDHAADALRYLCMSRPAPGRDTTPPPEAVRGRAGELMADIRLHAGLR